MDCFTAPDSPEEGVSLSTQEEAGLERLLNAQDHKKNGS